MFFFCWPLKLVFTHLHQNCQWWIHEKNVPCKHPGIPANPADRNPPVRDLAPQRNGRIHQLGPLTLDVPSQPNTWMFLSGGRPFLKTCEAQVKKSRPGGQKKQDPLHSSPISRISR